MIGVITRHIERAVFQSINGVLYGVNTCLLCLSGDVQRIGLHLRCAWQPAHALGFGVVING